MGKKTRERKKKNERTFMSFLCSMVCCRKNRGKTDDAPDMMGETVKEAPRDKQDTSVGETTNVDTLNRQDVGSEKEVVFSMFNDSEIYLPSDDLKITPDGKSAESAIMNAINEIFERNRYRGTPLYETEEVRSESQQVYEKSNPQILSPLQYNAEGQQARSRKLRKGRNVVRRTQPIMSVATTTIEGEYEDEGNGVEDGKGILHGDSIHNKVLLNDQDEDNPSQFGVVEVSSKKAMYQDDAASMETVGIVSIDIVETTDNIEEPNKSNNGLITNTVVPSVNRALESDSDDVICWVVHVYSKEDDTTEICTNGQISTDVSGNRR